MWLGIWIIAVIGLSLYDYFLLKHKQGNTLLALWLLYVGLTLPLPLLVPKEFVIVGFLFAIFSFGKIIKSGEIAHRSMPDPRMVDSFGRYLLWCICLPDTFWPTNSEEASQARRDGRRRIWRALPKVAVFLALLCVFTAWPDVTKHYWLFMFVFLWCCYFAATGFTDLFTGFFMQTGIRVSEMFDWPFLSRSPRDFWGRRWNLYFRDLARRNIFVPLGGARRPVLASFVVFFVSGVFHEYLIYMSVGGQKLGWMLSFFLVHWLGTIVQTAVSHWLRKKEVMPRPIAILLHTAWMWLTVPLLAEPLLLVVPVHTWLLW